MYSVILTELGIAVFDDNKCVKSFPFSNPATQYVELKKEQAHLNELEQFLTSLGSAVIVNDSSLLKQLRKKSIEADLMEEKKIETIQSSKLRVLVDSGFATNEGDARGKLRDFALSLSSSRVTEISESPDLHIIQAINTLDETDKIINLLSSRVREWYGLHFPELDNLIDTISGYSKIVVEGRRDNFTQSTYTNAGFPEEKAEMLFLLQKKSRGGQISDENLSIVQSIAKQILDLFELRQSLEKHIETQMEKIAPNTTVILGSAVGARVLAKAGSLKRLATMPASTIQVLGAEKALFRALKTGAQPPKHGLLFQHQLVHSAPRWQRGKIARAIAAKAAIGARVDVYGGGRNDTLLEKLNVRVGEIGEKYKDQPERPAVQPRRNDERQDRRFDRRDRRFGGGRGGGDKRNDWQKSKRKKFGKRRR
ncbi:Pre-mRNA processing ribonucleoprotein, binding domain protein [Nitrosotalea sinensis]|jgi:nucleolar protein 56|uniref:Pre-mRNA processing ribonucleoprotein, binding domain protein n=1 Tax=Nitrosotalea sinensis TaxID=1499975 RepID=A0A2H1EGX6_9ARCH|nr:ribonucleotide-diphosphate reductase subunit beta [Candidatus Nitrosotalea sinensis]SHO45138.1 Pre-mRNA processing ribonucleoprotein, binding domain protein [Candidatus Nitrosotalea sinensis]